MSPEKTWNLLTLGDVSLTLVGMVGNAVVPLRQRPSLGCSGSMHNDLTLCQRVPTYPQMELRELLRHLVRRIRNDRDEFSESADLHNSAAATMHDQAAKEHQQAAKEHHGAAKLHAMGAHRRASTKGDEAVTTGHRAASSGSEASSEEAQARQQNDLDTGRLYLGD